MHERRRIALAVLILLIALTAGYLAGCGGNDSLKPSAGTGTCLGCHQDAELLVATADPEGPPPVTDPGEG